MYWYNNVVGKALNSLILEQEQIGIYEDELRIIDNQQRRENLDFEGRHNLFKTRFQLESLNKESKNRLHKNLAHYHNIKIILSSA